MAKRKSSNKKNDFFGGDGVARFIIDQIVDQVVIIDSNARIAYLNKSAARIYGKPVKELLGKSITTYIKGRISGKEWKRKYFLKAKRTHRPTRFELIRRIPEKKKEQHIEVTAVHINHNGRGYLLCCGRDITKRVQLQNQLKDSEENYKRLFESAGDSIFITDLDGVIVYANKNAEKLVNIKRKDYIGKHFEKFLPEKSFKKAWASFRKTVRTGEIVRDELDITDKKGNNVPIEFTSSPIQREGKVVQVHTIVRDISHRREIQNFIQANERMKAAQVFVSGIAQEIQHPIKGIMRYSQYLVDAYKDRAFEYIGYKEFREIMGNLEMLRDQAEYCSRTAERLLSLNRRKLGLESEHCDVNHLLRQISKSIKHELSASNIKLHMKLKKALPAAAIDPIDLRRAMTIIIHNSIQAMPGGGNLTFKTSLVKEKTPVKIEIKDDGVGIPRDSLSRVFDPFFTTKERGVEKSSGLGLTIAHSIIEAFHGEIKIRSNLRQGTSVAILLPKHE